MNPKWTEIIFRGKGLNKISFYTCTLTIIVMFKTKAALYMT